jgi:arsenate reductase-like glutaredoxin family protein
MMKLKNIIALADAAAVDPDAYNYWRDQMSLATVKRMAELLVQCREALEREKRTYRSNGLVPQTLEALAALDEFEGEK